MLADVRWTLGGPPRQSGVRGRRTCPARTGSTWRRSCPRRRAPAAGTRCRPRHVFERAMRRIGLRRRRLRGGLRRRQLPGRRPAVVAADRRRPPARTGAERRTRRLACGRAAGRVRVRRSRSRPATSSPGRASGRSSTRRRRSPAGLESGRPPRAGRRPRRRAVLRRERADRPGRRPHPRRGQPAVDGQRGRQTAGSATPA